MLCQWIPVLRKLAHANAMRLLFIPDALYDISSRLELRERLILTALQAQAHMSRSTLAQATGFAAQQMQMHTNLQNVLPIV